MSKTEKLLTKLKNGSLDGLELITLLKRLGWYPLRQVGSHQTWSNGIKSFTVIAGRVDLKPYQIKEARKLLLPEEK
jgi:predicted RNA binding protein YcfA (HicA-like mRNA interferase family)